jgi:NAD(P) transhydrogenase subunit alpha
MKLAIAKEKRPNESRVAATPDTVKKLKGLGLDIMVETGAGAGAHIADEVFAAAGATIGSQVLQDADVIFKVQRPLDDEIALMKRGAMLVAILAPYGDKAGVQK